MHKREFGRTGWEVSEIGYGMWGLGSWSGSEDQQSLQSLQNAVELGCNFFDTANAYGEGRSESLLGQIVRSNNDKKLYTATKIPPKNKQWPALPGSTLQDSYPPDHVEEFVHRSLRNADIEAFDLVQFHTWDDQWLKDDRWFYKLDDLRTGQIDAVQVIYNIFDQNPEDELFPVCEEMNVAVIARVPFDEGTLTGTLMKDSHWPDGDWRNTYFVPENLIPSVERADALREELNRWNQEHEGDGVITMPALALRFILSNPTVSTIIPGMRKLSHVQSNIAASGAGPLPSELLALLKKHKWVRKPASWSQ
jgi:aryl-alcohol dehydrogenase-like predicted oxidoreductase